MEKFDHQEYRDELAHKLKDIRNSDSENVAKTHAKAEGFLESQQETDEYKKAEIKHREEAMENMPFNMATFEQYIGMKEYTPEELAKVLAGDKEPSEELLQIASEGLDAIKQIKDNGFILENRFLVDWVVPVYNLDLHDIFSGISTYLISFDEADKEREKKYIRNDLIFSYFKEYVEKIQKLLSKLPKDERGKVDISKGLGYDLFATISDCPCNDSDCGRIFLDEKVNYKLLSKFKEERIKRWNQFFKDHKAEIEALKAGEERKEREEEEGRELEAKKNREIAREEKKKKDLEKFDPQI